MGLLLTLLVLAASAYGLRLYLLADPWQGERRNGLRYQATRLRSAATLRAAVDTPTTLEFEVRPESGFDRLAKRLGLSEEAQVGDPVFQRKCYLVADDPQLLARLRALPELTEALGNLTRGWLAQFELRRLVCRDGELRVDLVRFSAGEPGDALLDQAERRLRAVVALLPDDFGREHRPDAVFLRAVLAVSIAGALAINGGLQLLRAWLVHLPFEMHPMKLWAMTPPLLLAGGALLFLLVLKLVGRTSRAHTVLATSMFLGLFGLVGSSHGVLVDLNRGLDFSAARTCKAEVIRAERKRHGGHRRHFYTYHLTMLSLECGDARGRFSREQFLRWGAARGLALRVHEGFLGLPWVDSVEVTGERVLLPIPVQG